MRLARAARIVLVTTVACVLAPAVEAATPVPESRPTAEQKRCAAAQRRVERHRAGLASLDAQLDRDRTARANCTQARVCNRLDREIHSQEARRRRIAKQFAQYEQEQAAICAKGR